MPLLQKWFGVMTACWTDVLSNFTVSTHPHPPPPQGDYDRHLSKVSSAMDHKRAMLDSLLGRASLHLLLLLLGTEELRRLGSLCGDLQGTAQLLEAHAATTEARVQW